MSRNDFDLADVTKVVAIVLVIGGLLFVSLGGCCDHTDKHNVALEATTNAPVAVVVKERCVTEEIAGDILEIVIEVILDDSE